MDTRYVIVVEHDLSVLDYLSDFICCLYGVPGAYGVVTMPFSVREGLFSFLRGSVVVNVNLRLFILCFLPRNQHISGRICSNGEFTFPRRIIGF